AKKGIQPVWIEVENHDAIAYWLMSPGLDPHFFPASEAADGFTAGRRDEIERRVLGLAFPQPGRAGTTRLGFVLYEFRPGMKMVQVDLVASGSLKGFSFFNIVPGFRADYHSRQVFLRDVYAPEAMTDYTNDDAFRAALEALPCCATNKQGTRHGDPLNLVVVGGLEDA